MPVWKVLNMLEKRCNYLWLEGYGNTCDVYHMTSPSIRRSRCDYRSWLWRSSSFSRARLTPRPRATPTPRKKGESGAIVVQASGYLQPVLCLLALLHYASATHKNSIMTVGTSELSDYIEANVVMIRIGAEIPLCYFKHFGFAGHNAVLCFQNAEVNNYEFKWGQGLDGSLDQSSLRVIFL